MKRLLILILFCASTSAAQVTGGCPASYPAQQTGSTGISSVPTTLTGGTSGSPAKYHLTDHLITATGSEDAIIFPKTGANRGYVILDLRGFDIEGFGNATGGGVNPNGWYIYSSEESVLRPGDCPEWRANGATVINVDSNVSFAFVEQAKFQAFRIKNESTQTSGIKRGLLFQWWSTGAEPASATILLQDMEGEVTATSSSREIVFDFVNATRATVQDSKVTCGTGNVEGSGIAAFNINYLTVTNTNIFGNCFSRSVIQDHLAGASSSVSRSGGIVTVNTTKPHRASVGLSGRLGSDPGNCTPSSFNGVFDEVATVVDNDTFTFAQAGSDESGSCTGGDAWQLMSLGASFTDSYVDVGTGRCARFRGVRDFTMDGVECDNINSSTAAIDIDQCGSGAVCANGDIGTSFIRDVTFNFTGGTGIFVRGTWGDTPGTHGGLQVIRPVITGTSGRFIRVDPIFGVVGEATVENASGGTGLGTASQINTNGTLNLCPTGSLNTTGSGTVVSYDTCSTPAPEITLSPSTLTFSNTVVGQSSPPNPNVANVITIENTGDATATFSSQPALATGTEYSLVENCGATLAASASCTATITFTPTSAGVKNDTLTMATDAAGSPHTAAISGTGIVSVPPTTTPTTPAMPIPPSMWVIQTVKCHWTLGGFTCGPTWIKR